MAANVTCSNCGFSSGDEEKFGSNHPDLNPYMELLIGLDQHIMCERCILDRIAAIKSLPRLPQLPTQAILPLPPLIP